MKQSYKTYSFIGTFFVMTALIIVLQTVVEYAGKQEGKYIIMGLVGVGALAFLGFATIRENRGLKRRMDLDDEIAHNPNFIFETEFGLKQFLLRLTEAVKSGSSERAGYLGHMGSKLSFEKLDACILYGAEQGILSAKDLAVLQERRQTRFNPPLLKSLSSWYDFDPNSKVDMSYLARLILHEYFKAGIVADAVSIAKAVISLFERNELVEVEMHNKKIELYDILSGMKKFPNELSDEIARAFEKLVPLK